MEAISSEEKNCPSCKATIPAQADKCAACGSDMPAAPTPASASGSLAAKTPLWQTILSAAIIITVAKFGISAMVWLRAQSPVLNVVYVVVISALVLFGFYVLFKAIFGNKAGKK